MGKIGIYVPDERVKELEAWKPKLNLSEIFWEAFDRTVERHKATKLKGSAVEDLIARLKNEQDEDHQAGTVDGFNAGSTWATKSAKLKDLRRIAEADEDDGIDADGLESMLADYYGHREVKAMMEHDNHDAESYRNGFCEGFCEGVGQVWNQVKDEI